jgi:dipeptidyl aminopeptidase/acylaminoacyl peptidase
MRLDAHGVVATVAERPDGSARAAFAWRGRELLLFGQRAMRANRRPGWYALRSAQRADALTSALPDVSASLAAIEGCATAMSASDGIWCLDDRRPRRIFGPDVHIANGTAIGWRVASEQVMFEGGMLTGRAVRIGATDQIERVDASPTGRMFVVRTVASSGTKALILASLDQADIIAKANLHLRDVAAAVARPLSHQLPDGREVTSWLFLPPNARAGEGLGLVVIPYPGQSYGGEPPAGLGPATARFHASVQLLASRGYAVLLPSLPFRPDAPDGAPGFVEAVDRAVDAAVATGTVDPQRIALWGHSYGAYAVAMIATQTCRYATAIVSAGIYDLGAVPGIFGPTLRLAPELGIPIGLQFAWAETGQGNLGVPPWADPVRYVSASPVYHADRITLPMLIIAADRDVSPMQQAEQLFSALFRQGKDAELVTYWGEGHVVGSPANVRDLYGRVFTWLDETLALPHMGPCDPTASHPPAPPRRAPNAP